MFRTFLPKMEPAETFHMRQAAVYPSSIMPAIRHLHSFQKQSVGRYRAGTVIHVIISTASDNHHGFIFCCSVRHNKSKAVASQKKTRELVKNTYIHVITYVVFRDIPGAFLLVHLDLFGRDAQHVRSVFQS